jgi:hypothetical protein
MADASVPPDAAASLVSPAAGALRLAQLGVALRAHQAGGNAGAHFGGVRLTLVAVESSGGGDCSGDAPSFELTCGAVWAWGAAARSAAYRDPSAPAEVELFEVARASAWRFIEAAEAEAGAASQGGSGLGPADAAALLLAAASELLLGNDEPSPMAARAATALLAAADAAAAGGPPLPHPAPWLALPLLLFAHASGREDLGREGRRLVLRAAFFPELPHVWWDAERPAAGLSAWAGAVAGAAVACQARPARGCRVCLRQRSSKQHLTPVLSFCTRRARRSWCPGARAWRHRSCPPRCAWRTRPTTPLPRQQSGRRMPRS